MQAFLNANSGIVSRIGYTLEFEDYTNKELREIFIKMLTKAGFNIEDEALKKFDEIIIENRNTKNFGNARFVRNTFEKTILKHAANTKSNKDIKILKTITKEDIAY
jgi:Holliday junction resolvasome RuvABC ATP-dependent DNA helicase subunit